MENKIMFLIVAILLIYVIFTPTGQAVILNVFNLKKESTPDLTDDNKYKKYSGGASLPPNVG